MSASWLKTKSQEWIDRVKKRGFFYWVRLFITVLIVQSLVTWADNHGLITDARYAFYRLLQRLDHHPSYDQSTDVITVDDDEYYKGALQERIPIKRDYLAHLIEKLDVAEAKVIALDFDLRSPSPDGNPVESPDYASETHELLETIKQVAVRRQIVLPRTVWKQNGEYVTNSDIYDGFDFGSAHVFKGYIALPYERLEIPLTLKLKGDVPLDSFSMAIVRAFQSKALDYLPQKDRAPYASFISEKDFDHRSAHEVLTGDPDTLHDKVSGHIVIIGAAWRKWAFGTGARVDLHPTPMGSMPGAYLHANYVEAILGNRTYPLLSIYVVKAVEWIVVVAMALGFAATETPAWKPVVVVVSWLLLLLFTYFSFVNLGHVFDLFVPAISVTVHWVFEHFYEGFQKKAAAP